MIQRRKLLGAASFLATLPGLAREAAAQGAPAPLNAREGWVVMPTPLTFDALIERLEDAVKSNKMGLVNLASASDGAKAQGIAILGNRVVGVFRNDFARRLLAASIPAGIEAPIRFYITENSDGTAVLSYQTPRAVLEPYFNGAGDDLHKVAGELDLIFASIAADAARPSSPRLQ